MSVIVMHLRFDDLAAAQTRAVRAQLAVEKLPSSCWSHTSRASGTAMLMTLAWADGASAVAFTDGPLAALVADACLDEPQVVMFAVSDLFAPAYRRATVASIPLPRDVDEAAQAVATR